MASCNVPEVFAVKVCLCAYFEDRPFIANPAYQAHRREWCLPRTNHNSACHRDRKRALPPQGVIIMLPVAVSRDFIARVYANACVSGSFLNQVLTRHGNEFANLLGDHVHRSFGFGHIA